MLLINVVEDVQRALDQQKQVDPIMLDLQKAFDTVPHQRLLCKLQKYGIRGSIIINKFTNGVCDGL